MVFTTKEVDAITNALFQAGNEELAVKVNHTAAKQIMSELDSVTDFIHIARYEAYVDAQLQNPNGQGDHDDEK
jgi:hypothetical protein